MEPDDEAALATYRSAGATDDGRFAMLTWEFGIAPGTGPPSGA
ncbi:hypothetical protein [Streptomyces sp. HB132]|nr:hypothetical protein [Streptomyces sp. HB132]MBM7439088.1 hypothetical protein [Streptomyces sp. HB132]